MTTSTKLTILFLCRANSARSIMAEQLMRARGASKFEASSAGTEPAGAIHPMTRKVLEERFQIDLTEARSKSINDLESSTFDFVVTLCDQSKEECPLLSGNPVVAHWSSPDPIAFEGTPEETERYFFQVAMLLHRRIELFCSLPFEKLDHYRLEQMTGDIGLESNTVR